MMVLKREFEQLATASLGKEVAARLFTALTSQGSASSSIRLNPFKFSSLSNFLGDASLENMLETPDLTPVAWCNDAFYLKDKMNFTLSPLFQSGVYYVQDSSSMFLELLEEQIEQFAKKFYGKCSLSKQLCALDLCAAPGGKSTHLISLLSRICASLGAAAPLILCNEAVSKRAGALRENIAKWGYDITVVTSNYPAEFKRLKDNRFGGFDIILADVPCSGEGMFRKSAEALEEWSLANVNKCAQLQRDILKSIWPLLKEGGLLIYSTCTYNHLENADNVRFIAEELGAENLNPYLYEKAKNAGAIAVSGEPLGYQFVPGIINGEGQFFSLLEKKGDISPSKLLSEKASVIKSLKVISDARIAEIKGKDAVPSADFALSNKLLQTLVDKRTHRDENEEYMQLEMEAAKGVKLKFAVAEANKELALKYLRKDAIAPEEIASDVKKLPTGYILLTYKHMPLGFIKNLGNRINNLLPNNRRILSSW